MERRQVLLRKTEGDSYVQVGLITARQGKLLTVRTDAGHLTNQQRGPGDLTPDEGSYFHLLRVSPATVERLLNDEPARIFKQVIHDFPGLTSTSLREKLGPSVEAASKKAWDRAKPLLEADEDVIASRGSMPKYRLRKEARVDLLDVLPDHAAASPSDGDIAVSTPAVPEKHAEASRPDAAYVDARPSPVETAVPASRFVEHLGQIARGLDLRSTSDIASHLLAVGAAVSGMPARAQATLVASLDADERRMLSVSTGELKGGLLTDEVGALGVTDYESALDAGIREIESCPGERKVLTRALAQVLQRATDGRRLPPDLLVRLARTFSGRPMNENGLDLCLVQLSEALASLPTDAFTNFDLQGLASATASAPLSRTGGRARLMSTLYRTMPDEVTNVRWWAGATLESLSDAARGVLGPVLEDDRVASQTVAPIVRSYVDGASTRSSVSVVWGLPVPLARHASGEQLLQTLRRVGARDRLLESWLDTLAGTAIVRTLQDRVDELETDADRGREALVRAANESDTLRERLRITAEQLAASRNEEAGNRDSHDRQVRIDAVRAVAVLAAHVRQSSAARADEALMRQVEHACRREGLDEFDSAGEPTVYDPERHELLSGSLLPGSPATVLRGGYTWGDGDQRVVLVKAHVMAR